MVTQNTLSSISNRPSSTHPLEQNVYSKSALKSAKTRTPTKSTISHRKKGIFALMIGAVLAFSNPTKAEESLDTETNITHSISEKGNFTPEQYSLAREYINPMKEPSLSGRIFEVFSSQPKTVRDVRLEFGPKLNEIVKLGNKKENDRFDSLVEQFSEVYGHDPVVVQDMVIRESKGKNSATSSKGAKGLFQVMPDFMQDMLGEDGGRWFKYYGEKILAIPMQLAAKIPDISIRNALISYISDPDSHKKYQFLTRSISSNPRNPYASMLMGFLCLDAFRDSAAKRDPDKLVAEVRSQVRQVATNPVALQKVNRSRVIDGKPEISPAALKKAVHQIGEEEATNIKTLSGYGGTGKSPSYALIVGAIDSLISVED